MAGKDNTTHSTSPEIIILDDDSQEENNSSLKRPRPSNDEPPVIKNTDPPDAPVSSFLQDRAQMEKERLARMQERNRKQAQREQEGTSTSLVKNKKVKLSTMANSDNNGNKNIMNIHQLLPQEHSSDGLSISNANSQDGTRYWNGAIKLTYNSLCDSPGSLSLTEVIGPKSRLKNVICSSFDTDLDFVVDNFPKNVNIMLVMPSDGRTGIFSSSQYPNLRLCFPVVKNRGAMHIKFIMLLYDTFFRFVVPTANLRPHDWELIENAMFIHDFKPGNNIQSTFGSDINSLLNKLGVPSGCSDGLKKFDLSSADKSYQLITSLSGTYTDTVSISKYGHTGLSHALEKLNVDIKEDEVLEAEYQGSSLGMYKTQSSNWIAEFYRSLTMKTPYQVGEMGTIPPISILFPTEDTIYKSILGPNGAMTLFCNEKSWTQLTPKQRFRDVQSKRSNVLMHTKMLLGLISSKYCRDKPKSGFLYVGSHNFTPSAWGRHSETKGKMKLSISNHELGVVMKLDENQVQRVDDIIPWVRPTVPYKSTDKPWVMFESQSAEI